MNHASSTVAPPDAEAVEVGDAIWQRAPGQGPGPAAGSLWALPGRRRRRAGSADVLREEKGGPVQRLIGLVENACVRMENMGNFGGDVEDHVHIGRPRARGQARGVVQDHLIGARLDEHRREACQVAGEGRADQGLARVLPCEVHRHDGFEARG